MSSSRRARVLLPLLGLGLLAGCSFKLGDDSAGDKGVLRFQYSSSACLFGCGLDRSALQGSTVTVEAKGKATVDTDLTASLTNGDVGRISGTTTSCTCDSSTGDGSSSSRTIDRNESCSGNETKTCTVSVDVETTGAGDTRLELKDPTGAVVDGITVKVRPASRIETSVRAGDADLASTGDTYDVKRGQKIELKSKVLVDDGTEAVFTRGGLSHAYGDESILRPDSKVLIGATDVEYIATGAAGETTVTTSAAGATSVTKFRVE